MENVDILIEHGIVLTLNKDRHIITDGAVAQSARTALSRSARRPICKAGSRAPRPSMHRCGWSTPGLVDGHAHLGEIARGLIPDTLRTSDWLKFWCYPYMAAITEEDEYWNSKSPIAETIRSGTTCFVEPGCMWLNTTIKAIEESGFWQHHRQLGVGSRRTPRPQVSRVLQKDDAAAGARPHPKATHQSLLDGMADGRGATCSPPSRASAPC